MLIQPRATNANKVTNVWGTGIHFNYLGGGARVGGVAQGICKQMSFFSRTIFPTIGPFKRSRSMSFCSLACKANCKLETHNKVRSSCARFKSIRIDAGLCICNANLCIFLQMQSESLITRCMNRYKSNMQYYEVMQIFANLKHICSNLHKSI